MRKTKRKTPNYVFDHVADGAYHVWDGRDHLGTLLHVQGRWEAYASDGRQVIGGDHYAVRFKTRTSAAEVLDRMRQE